MDTARREALLRDVRAWLADDPDPQTRSELSAIIDADEVDTLADSFGEALTFGTAGIRGVVGLGPSRMNRRTVARTTAGVCRNLLDTVNRAAQRGLCIGFDGRRDSRAFAEETAMVALGAGLRVFLFDVCVPTPLLAFAVLQRGAAGGVMVTASHNPPEYNGYKVYGPTGAQIVSPRDAEITAAIRGCGAALALPRVALADARTDGQLHALGEETTQRYLQALPQHVGSGTVTPSIAYTALHGVGDSLTHRALGQAGFLRVYSVASQAQPDPDFPTVAFPNPEEPGAMDALFALAERENTDIALANDPDADRLAAAARDEHGVMRALTGDQLGALLADHVLSTAPRDSNPVALRSIVSSRMLEPIAAHHGARAYTTLTGFKWIYARARELEAEGATMAFGYEEALGYSFGRPARDKDGVHAAVTVAELARTCAADGKTLWHRLAELYDRHGYHLTAQHSVRYGLSEGRQKIDASMASLRAAPPGALGPHPVTSYQDMLEGGALPATDLVIMELSNLHRVCVRPSGTEPKIKLYFECVSHLERTAAEAEALQALEEIRSGLLATMGLV